MTGRRALNQTEQAVVALLKEGAAYKAAWEELRERAERDERVAAGVGDIELERAARVTLSYIEEIEHEGIAGQMDAIAVKHLGEQGDQG